MKRMAKRGYEMDIAARCQDTADFIHNQTRIADVFKNRIALDTLKSIGGEW